MPVPDRSRPTPRAAPKPHATEAPPERAALELCRALDALVRSIRTLGNTPERALERVFELWAHTAWAPLELGPTTLAVGGARVLSTGAGEARWLLPAFMAGLRALRPNADFQRDDLRRLAERLARLDAEVATLEAFRDWLWSGAVQGLELELQNSFLEVIDETLADDSLSTRGELDDGLAAVRAEMAHSLADDTLPIASRDLDVVAVREEFDAPLDATPPRAGHPALALREAVREDLAARCNDPVTWSAEELATVLASRPLQRSVPPEQLAARLTRALRTRFDPDLLDLASTLCRRNDPYARQVVALLEDTGIAETAVLVLAGSEPGQRLLGDFLVVAPAALARSIAHRLLDGASAERGVLVATERITRAVGLQRFCDFLDPVALTRHEARGLARLFACARGGTNLVAGMLPRVPARALPALVVGLDPDQLDALHDTLTTLLAELPASALCAQVEPVLATHGPRGAALLGKVLAAQAGRAWTPGALRAVCAALISHRVGHEHLLSLVRSRRTETVQRLELLELLAADGTLLAEAVRWHPGELLDPPAMRARLRELRAGRTR